MSSTPEFGEDCEDEIDVATAAQLLTSSACFGHGDGDGGGRGGGGGGGKTASCRGSGGGCGHRTLELLAAAPLELLPSTQLEFVGATCFCVATQELLAAAPMELLPAAPLELLPATQLSHAFCFMQVQHSTVWHLLQVATQVFAFQAGFSLLQHSRFHWSV